VPCCRIAILTSPAAGRPSLFPVQTGAALAALALAVVVASDVAQAVVGRVGVRPVLTTGLLALASRLRSSAACRWRDTSSGISSPPSCSAAPAWESPSSPRRLEASPAAARRTPGRIRSRQHEPPDWRCHRSRRNQRGRRRITNSYVDSHPEVQASGALALTHGLQIGLYILTALLLFGALIAATLVKPRPPSFEAERARDQQPEVLHETA
jgi:hypothetical protein